MVRPGSEVAMTAPMTAPSVCRRKDCPVASWRAAGATAVRAGIGGDGFSAELVGRGR